MTELSGDELLWALLDELQDGHRSSAKELARKVSDRHGVLIDRRAVNQVLYAETDFFAADGDSPPLWRLHRPGLANTPPTTPVVSSADVRRSLQAQQPLVGTGMDRLMASLSSGSPAWIRCTGCGSLARGYRIADEYVLVDGTGQGALHTCPPLLGHGSVDPREAHTREIVFDSKVPDPQPRWEIVRSKPLPPFEDGMADSMKCAQCGGLLIAAGRYPSCPHCST